MKAATRENFFSPHVSPFIPALFFLLYQIDGADRVHFSDIGVVFDQTHVVELVNIRNRASFTGDLECVGCANRTKSFSMTRDKYVECSGLILSSISSHPP